MKPLYAAIGVVFVVMVVGLVVWGGPAPAKSGESISGSADAPAAEEARKTESGWLVWYNEALEESKETGKPILANFTGSDWCPPCIMVKRDVFDKEAFKAWAEENVVLLELDFPRAKPQSEQLQNQNRQLQRAYQIRGYPTLMLLNSEGEEEVRWLQNAGMSEEAWLERADRAVEEMREAADEGAEASDDT